MKIQTTILILALLTGCGGASAESSSQKSSKQKNADIAHRLAQEGKVGELRSFLEEHPAAVRTPVIFDAFLLDVVLDTRPEFPNMIDSIEVLLEAGSDPNHEAPELLRKAIWRQHPETLELLLRYGADPTVYSEKKKMDMVEYAQSSGDERLQAIMDAWLSNNGR